MGRFCALLRGINVGGKHRVAMNDLLAVAEDLSFTNASTYIQSGNLIFSAEGHEADLAASLSHALEEAFGFAIPLVIRTASEIAEVLSASPFATAADNVVMVAFCGAGVPQRALALDPSSVVPEEFFLAEREVHLFVPSGLGNSTLPRKLGLLAPPTTIRNLATVRGIAARC